MDWTLRELGSNPSPDAEQPYDNKNMALTSLPPSFLVWRMKTFHQIISNISKRKFRKVKENLVLKYIKLIFLLWSNGAVSY